MQNASEDDISAVAEVHRELFEAIRTGDAAHALKALRHHLETSKNLVLNAGPAE